MDSDPEDDGFEELIMNIGSNDLIGELIRTKKHLGAQTGYQGFCLVGYSKNSSFKLEPPDNYLAKLDPKVKEILKIKTNGFPKSCEDIDQMGIQNGDHLSGII